MLKELLFSNKLSNQDKIILLENRKKSSSNATSSAKYQTGTTKPNPSLVFGVRKDSAAQNKTAQSNRKKPNISPNDKGLTTRRKIDRPPEISLKRVASNGKQQTLNEIKNSLQNYEQLSKLSEPDHKKKKNMQERKSSIISNSSAQFNNKSSLKASEHEKSVGLLHRRNNSMALITEINGHIKKYMNNNIDKKPRIIQKNSSCESIKLDVAEVSVGQTHRKIEQNNSQQHLGMSQLKSNLSKIFPKTRNASIELDTKNKKNGSSSNQPSINGKKSNKKTTTSTSNTNINTNETSHSSVQKRKILVESIKSISQGSDKKLSNYMNGVPMSAGDHTSKKNTNIDTNRRSSVDTRESTHPAKKGHTKNSKSVYVDDSVQVITPEKREVLNNLQLETTEKTLHVLAPISQIDLTTATTPRHFNKEQAKLIEYINEMHLVTKRYPSTSLDFYSTNSLLGKGSFGQVHLATQILTGEKVAIKVFDKNKLQDDHSKNKVIQEVNIMRKLNHPNVIKLLEVFENKYSVFLVMEVAENGDVLNMMRKIGKLSESDARPIFQQIVLGLENIHNQNVLHRDIKLDNILLDKNNVVKICDFGVSRVMPGNELINEQCGTPAYLAPEIILEKGYKGFQADIWSLGILLYAMCSATVPFSASNIPDLHKLILKGCYSIPSYFSSKLQNLIKKMIVLDPEARITLQDIKSHPWTELNDVDNKNNEILQDKKDMLIDVVSSFGYSREYIEKSLENKLLNHATACFSILNKNQCSSNTNSMNRVFYQFKKQINRNYLLIYISVFLYISFSLEKQGQKCNQIILDYLETINFFFFTNFSIFVFNNQKIITLCHHSPIYPVIYFKMRGEVSIFKCFFLNQAIAFQWF